MPVALGPHQVPAWLLLGCGAFGALWGSFLNVVIVRLPRGESIVFPASHCVACGAPIPVYDNIPILSYLILRGRCRRCGSPYSPRYAIVELVTGLAAAWSVDTFGLSIAALGYFVFLALLVAIAAIDLEHWVIPHELSWPGIALGLLFSPFNPRVPPRAAASGAILAFILFTLIAWLGGRLLKREALGLGDRWLLAMEGSFLGAGGLLPVVFLASVQGSIVGLLLIVVGRAQTGEVAPTPPQGAAPLPEASVAPDASGAVDSSPAVSEDEDWVPPKNSIPFGPFLALAGAEWLLLGPPLLDWYHRQVGQLFF
jgi:leader peptidase (prepilin peptidase)/N-methyltransferase